MGRMLPLEDHLEVRVLLLRARAANGCAAALNDSVYFLPGVLITVHIDEIGEREFSPSLTRDLRDGQVGTRGECDGEER